MICFQNFSQFGVPFLSSHIKRLYPLVLIATRKVFCSQNGVLFSVPFVIYTCKKMISSTFTAPEWCSAFRMESNSVPFLFYFLHIRR